VRPQILRGTFEALADTLVRANRSGAGIFFCVNYCTAGGRTADHISGIRALFVDLDGAPLAPVQAAAVQAHALIESSPGRFHAYWAVSGCELRDFKPLQLALAEKFSGDRTVHDLPRVMRLPGFVHRKGQPFRSRILASDEVQPYPVDALVARLGLRPAKVFGRENIAVINHNGDKARSQDASGGPVDVDRQPAGVSGHRGAIFAQGGRNAALARVAGSLRRQGLAPQAIAQALAAVNAAQCRPPLADDEVHAIARSIGRYAPAQATAAGDDWPAPIVPGQVQTPPIPAALLPDYLGAMAGAVARSTQTAEATAVMLTLPMIAAAVQRRFVVAPFGDHDYTEALAIWVLVALVSGARKTPILGALDEPLRHWEKLRRDALRPEIARRQAAIAVAKKRIERLQADASRADERAVRQRIEAEIQREIEEQPEELRAPRLLTGDVTAERLQGLLAEHEERMTLLSDEGGIFNILSGVYSGGAMHLDAFLQSWSGSSVRVDRAGRQAHLDKPALSFGLALQPGVLGEIANVRRFHDSGLLARYLFAIPESTVGHRDVRLRHPVPTEVRDRYARNLHALLIGADGKASAPAVIPFDPAARDRWLDFAQSIEDELRDGGRLEPVREWGAKLAGQVARIAGLLRLAVAGLEVRTVDLDSVDRAVQLGQLLVPHAQAAFRLMGADQGESDAVHLLRWIKATGLSEFDRATAHKALEGRFRSVDRLKAAAARLAEWHCISDERHRPNERARPTPYYVVNPRLFDLSSES
jgi:replicative DNA helicase